MTVTREHLIMNLQTQLGLKRGEAQQLVGRLFLIMKDALSRGEDLLISGFGKFLVKQKNSHRGRNVRTQESMTLAGRRVLVFKSSGVLRHRLNQGSPGTGGKSLEVPPLAP
jgi:integration host factor subunit alpha